jgi:ribonuclease D
LSHGRGIALVDPLAGLPLGPLFDLLQHRELILHGADYDLRLLGRTFRFVPACIFDTMLAARLLGDSQFGLGHLVAKHLNVTLEKGPQTADWARRPLTERMETYARNDVRYLQPLADILRAQLKQTGRLEWLRESCARLVGECAQTTPRDPDLVWRLPGSDRLGRPALAVLRELWRWREKEAIRRNRPPFFVLSHDALVALADTAARAQPVEPLFPRRFPPHARLQVLGVIAHGLALQASRQPLPRRPVRHRVTEAEKRRAAALKQRRDHRARELGIDPTLIASRATLLTLARDGTEPDRVLLGWQRALLT